MLSRIEFILEEKWIETSGEEAQDAAESYRTKGIGTGAVFIPEDAGLPEYWKADVLTLYLADSDRLLKLLHEKGVPAAGFSHAGNKGESLKGVPYVLEEPAYADRDSLVKIWQRLHKIPWRILTTEHCIVREFRISDLDAIAALYDEEACRWLEPPSRNREKEKAVLQAYIDRIYGLFGYGQWAVLSRDNGQVIGRMGFSFPTKVEGMKAPDAALGYLLAPAYRGKGLAREVCQEIIRYGFTQLDFQVISVEIDPKNTVSRRLALSLGFAPAGRAGEKDLYFLHRE